VGSPVGKIRYSGHHDIFLASAKEDLQAEALFTDEEMVPKLAKHNEWATRETARLTQALRDVDRLLADLQQWKAEQIAANSLHLFEDLVEDAERALLDRHREVLDALDHNPKIRVYPDIVSYRAYRMERHRKRILRHNALIVAEKATVGKWNDWIEELEQALPQAQDPVKREVPK
jgi:hypothetical protein